MSGDLSLPTSLRDHLAARGLRVTAATPVSGGMISQTARIDTTDGPVFAKWSAGASAEAMFLAEADGLAALADTGAVRVPAVLSRGGSAGEGTAFLVLEYVCPTDPRDPVVFRDRLAAALAALHGARPPGVRDGYGLAADNFIGVLPQRNLPRSERWAEFYRERRLIPQMAIARGAGRLTPERERLLSRVLDRLDELLASMPEEPSLLHGDLWSGNYLCAAGDETPVLIDPAAYFGPREMEIAFIELFGGFPLGFVAVYDAAYPLDAGYPYRRTLHQLYPLLVHLNHFGEAYGPAVERACREYLG